MKLREKLKEDASTELDAMIFSVQKKAGEIAKGSAITESDLLRLSYGGKTGTVRAKAVNAMASAAEEKLYQQYNKQQDFVSDAKPAGKKKNETQD